MYINSLSFDNTKSIRDFAKTAEAQRLLNIPAGHEVQLYHIGQKVDGNGHGFNVGTIVDVWCNNGYYRYEVEYKLKPRARKTYTTNLRQIDVVVID